MRNNGSQSTATNMAKLRKCVVILDKHLTYVGSVFKEQAVNRIHKTIIIIIIKEKKKEIKKIFGSYTRKTYKRFTTKDSCTWNITHNTESTAV
jgi:hypothetical protein